MIYLKKQENRKDDVSSYGDRLEIDFEGSIELEPTDEGFVSITGKINPYKR